MAGTTGRIELTRKKGGTRLLTAGALAIFTADVAFAAPPPHRPGRPARKANQATGILGAIRRLRQGIARGLDEGRWLPQVARQYPF
jgi:hypothetical protein